MRESKPQEWDHGSAAPSTEALLSSCGLARAPPRNPMMGRALEADSVQTVPTEHWVKGWACSLWGLVVAQSPACEPGPVHGAL